MTNENQENQILDLLADALYKAQQEMERAIKDSSNPHFRSKYADLSSIIDACIPALNKHGISVLQPIIEKDGKEYIETILLHKSGQRTSCFTRILYDKTEIDKNTGKQKNVAQAFGSGVTYARRYGLQSFICLGAEDDDGEKAYTKEQPKKIEVVFINDEQQEELKQLANQKGVSLEEVCQKSNAESLNKINVKFYQALLKGLNNKPDVVVDEVKEAE